MKVLLIHNRYQQKGGEDVVFQSEGNLLAAHGHSVDRLLFDNTTIRSKRDILLSGVGIVYNTKSAKIATVKMRIFQPDVIHVHNFFPLASPSIFFVAQAHQIPVVVTLHNYRLICPSYNLYYNGKIYEKSIHQKFPVDAILKGVYRNSKIQTATTVLMTGIHKLLHTWQNKVDKYIVLTEFAKQLFLDSSLNVPVDQLVVKPNFTEDTGAGSAVREDFFLFIGRLTEEKGILTLLESAGKLPYQLKIVGDGPLRGAVEAAVKANSRIEYLGFRDKTFVNQLLKQCRALIFPSVWYEGFPMTIVEAFAAGTPVICSRLGGMAEIVQDQQTGLHTEPGNAGDLAIKIDYLSKNPELAQTLGNTARATYEQNYTPEQNYQQLLAIYRSVIAANKRKLQPIRR